jgi:hypothetical protein
VQPDFKAPSGQLAPQVHRALPVFPVLREYKDLLVSEVQPVSRDLRVP